MNQQSNKVRIGWLGGGVIITLIGALTVGLGLFLAKQIENAKAVHNGVVTLSAEILVPLIAIIALICLAVDVAVVLIARKVEFNRIANKEEKADQFLEDASKSKGDFLSHMSHDIRTPINAIVGNTAIAAKVPGNPAKTQECLNKIEASSRQLLSLITDVLDMSRVESGEVEITRAPINLNSIYENCASIIKGQMGSRVLGFSTDFDITHADVFGDELHLRQVLIHVLGNAVKFTPDGGKIKFSAKEISFDENKNVIRIEIEDTGVGMSEDFLAHIWDAFSQENADSRTTYNGTGLGLTITKKYVELMGGKIKAESVLHYGSKFTIEIPYKINTEAQVEEEAPKTLSIKGSKILLVEDNEMNMEIALEILSDEGAIVDTAVNGQIALEKIKSQPAGTYDAVLMDIMMPVLNGLEATKEIRALEREDVLDLPIIAMTANAFDSDIKDCFDAGMNAHLSKPINIAETLRTISMFTAK